MPRKKTCPDTIKKYCEWCKKEYDCLWGSRKTQRYCSKTCSNADPRTKNKIISSQNKTYIEKYGDHPMRTEITKNNLRDSMLKKYGVDWGSKLPDHSIKIKKTKLARHGDENYNNLKLIQKTMRKKYGSKTSQQNVDIKNKTVITKKRKYFNIQLLPFLKSKNLIPEFTEEQYTNNHWTTKYKFRCEKCNHSFQHSLYHKNMVFCPKCSPVGKNKPELEIYDFLSNILPEENIKIRDRTVLSGKELDFYIPSKKIAIEHDGLYWHSEGKSGKVGHGKHSHVNKLKACAFHGIDLIRIFEDEWRYKPNVVKFLIKKRLGLLTMPIPEKTDVRSLSKNEYDNFVNENSLNLSNKITSIRIGLFIENKLVSAIGVQKNRKLSDVYDIIDIIQSNDTSYNINCVTVLVDYLIKKYSPISIVKYIDRRIEQWDYLLTYGFEIKDFNNPRWYLLSDDYKSRIYDTKTFVGNKIWDCGLIKIEYKK